MILFDTNAIIAYIQNEQPITRWIDQRQEHDAILAASALVYQATFVSYDRVFQRVSELDLETP